MTEVGVGERAERARRMRLWKRIGALAAIGGIAGFAAGFVHGRDSARRDVGFFEMLTTLPPWLVIGFVGFMLVSLIAISWVFVKSVDELEMADNLWASTAGFYVYSALFPSWWLLARAGVTPAVNHWVVFLASFVGAFAVYGWRKWSTR